MHSLDRTGLMLFCARSIRVERAAGCVGLVVGCPSEDPIKTTSLSLKTRGAYYGLSPEIGMFTSSISWNFGGIADDGTLIYNEQADGTMMSSLDKFNQAYYWVKENHPEVVCVNSASRWVEAGFSIFGDLKTATLGSGSDGLTFTREGSHWNDTGSKIIAMSLVPYFDFAQWRE